jgi:hypothetical protein
MPALKVWTSDRIFESSMPVTECGCWIWMRPIHKKGYAYASLKGKMTRVNRLSWEVHNGPITEGLHVLHKCDTPLCVNPDHLFLGTNTDNVRDKWEKDREVVLRGADHPRSKLNPHMVRLIRSSPLSCKELGRRLGVNSGTVSSVRSGKTWSHVL